MSPRHGPDDGEHAASSLFEPHPADLVPDEHAAASGVHPDDRAAYDAHGYDDDYAHADGHGHDPGYADDGGYGDAHPSGPIAVGGGARREHGRARRRTRRRRVVLALAVVVIVALGVGAWQLSSRVFHISGPADYTGEGTGSVQVTIHSGDGAALIGQRLADADVVESAAAFVDVARDDAAAKGIQPGVYAMRQHMSARSALTLLLAPSTKLTRSLTIREGAIEPVVLQDLATALQVPLDQVVAASQQIGQLGLPATYTTPTAPTSIEGFLYPATYSFDPGTSPLQALQLIVAQFLANDRSSGLSAAAAALGLSPYQLLTAASIAQAEVIFPEDAAKVTRVILNRLAAGRPLQVDPTSAYAAKIAGVDPTTIDYATYPSPYNMYLNAGLPPTPINSPGTAVLAQAAQPPAGDWLFYVNGDAEGHLFFTADEAAFAAAAQTCAANGWGCASQTGG